MAWEPNVTGQEIEGTGQIARGFRERAPLLLLILAVASTLALILIDATPLSTEFAHAIYVMPSILIIWAVIFVRSSTLFIRRTDERNWNHGVLPGFLLVTSILVFFNFFPFLRGCNYLGGALRFAMTRSYYENHIARLPFDGTPRLAVFNWGGMIWASKGVVYDESDEIALPLGQQSADWNARARSGELGCGNWDARRLSSHFYLVAFSC